MLPILMARQYGWRRPLPSPNRPLMNIVMPQMVLSQPLPRKFSLKKGMPNPYDQLDLGSCSGNTLARMVAYRLIKSKQITLIQSNTPGGTPSRLMIYFGARRREGTIPVDVGCAIIDCTRELHQKGSCMEEVWPYDVTKFAIEPPASAYRAARNDLVKDYAVIAIDDHVSKKMALFGDYPVGQGFTVFAALESAEVARHGKLPLPSATDEALGGHAITITGWDDDMQIGSHKGAWEVCNSWSRAWGLEGYFWAPYAYFDNPNLADDAQIVRTVT